MPSVICAVYTFYTPGRSNVKIDCCIFICQNTIIAILRRSKGYKRFLSPRNFNRGGIYRNLNILNNLDRFAGTQSTSFNNHVCLTCCHSGELAIAIIPQHFRIRGRPCHISSTLPIAVSWYKRKTHIASHSHRYLLRELQRNAFHFCAVHHLDIHITGIISRNAEIGSLPSSHAHKQSTLGSIYTIATNSGWCIFIQQDTIVAIFWCCESKGVVLLLHFH